MGSMIREWVLRVKYGGDVSSVSGLQEIVGRTAPTWEELQRPDAVVPIPLTRARRRRRGFNQAHFLAAPLATAYGLPILTRVLRRTRSARRTRRARRGRRAQVCPLTPTLRRLGVLCASAVPTPPRMGSPR